MTTKPQFISVIVTTYNWPSALKACLQSLQDQYDLGFEIIIADDGSSDSTRQLISELISTSRIAIRHVTHEDLGFRAGTIRNKAVLAAKGDYLLFMDGDCLALPSFIARHRLLAETAYFVPGNRVLLSQGFSEQLLSSPFKLHLQNLAFFIRQRITGNINRLTPFCYLPVSFLRYCQPKQWQKAMTCNLGVWKNDFLAVNGFDELFQGWGYEDSDLVIRLIHYGVKRKEGRFALPVLHLWHQHYDRSLQASNWQRLQDRIANQQCIRAELGLDQYRSLDERQ